MYVVSKDYISIFFEIKFCNIMGCGVVKEAEDNLRPLPSGRART